MGVTAAAEAGEGRALLQDLARQKYAEAAASGAELLLPEQSGAKAVLQRFYPRGPLPSDPHARALHDFVGAMEGGAGPVPMTEFDALRKQAGNKARALSRGMGETDPTAAAAWAAVKDLFDDAEAQALAKSDRLVPTGKGPWGPVYGGLAGDPENAVAHLLRTGRGEVPAAATHPHAGAVDLVAGNADYGLNHIAEQGREESLRRLPGLLRNGTWFSRPSSGSGRTYLSDGAHEGVVRMQWDDQAKQWMPTAYELTPKRKIPLETGRTTSRAGSGSGLLFPGHQAGDAIFPDIESSFKLFDETLNPAAPARNPRQYSGGLLGALLPEQAAPLRAGRSLHGERKARFDAGPLGFAWRTGADGMPAAQGAELGARLVHSGKTQVEDVQALKRAVLERGPTMRAAKDYAITDLIERSTQRGADADTAALLPAQYGRWMDARGGLLRELFDGRERGLLGAVRDDLSRATRASTLGSDVGVPQRSPNLAAQGGQAFERATAVRKSSSGRAGPCR